MPRTRYNNGIIGARQTTSATAASGIFGLTDYQVLVGAGLFPNNRPILKRFNISPSVLGKSTWDLDADGALSLDTAGTWTITPLSSYNLNVKMWGAGGTTALYSGGAGGSSVGVIAATNGTTYVIRVGAVNGGGAAFGTAGAGGGYSGIFTGSETFANSLIIAGGGGGGGRDDGGRGATGGAGGGTTGQSSSGFTGTTATGGTQSAGGTKGGGSSPGTSDGSQLTGGIGSPTPTLNYAGGGGGSGYYGGGGGGIQSAWASGGGAGGSGYIGGVTSATTYIGSGTTPGNNTDVNRGTAGNVGTAGKVYLY